MPDIQALLTPHLGKGDLVVTMTTETVPKLTGGKKNPMQGRVIKRTVGLSALIPDPSVNGNVYKSMIERRLYSEGKDAEDYTQGQRSFGARIPGTPFLEHEKDGELTKYLEIVCIGPGVVEYELDGKPIKKEDVEGLPVTKVNEESQGGLENKVIYRNLKFSSIVSIELSSGTRVL